MQKAVYEFVQLCADTLPFKGPIFEFGAFQAQGTPEEDLRRLFPGVDYVGCDMRPGPGVDRILDLHAIDVPTASVNAVLCMDTLEHVEFPRKAVSEIRRVLEKDGFAVFSTVFSFPIHGYPNDFWRFTPNGLKSLLQDYGGAFVGSIGPSPDSPQIVVGVGFNGETPDLAAFNKRYRRWERFNNAVIAKMVQDMNAGPSA